MSLKVKISLIVGILILLSMATTMAIISTQVKNASQGLNYAIAEHLAKHVASKISLILEKAMTTAKTLELSFRYARLEQVPRARLDQMLVEAIHQNERIFGTWMLWEPNRYDGLDQAFANAPGHEQTGRVNSYWHWHQQDIINEPNTGWQTASWYNNPKQRKIETLEDPYFYQVSEQQQLLISTIQPIIIDGEFNGVVGVDVDLTFLQQMIREINVQGQGYAELIAFNGMIIAHPDVDLVGTAASQPIIQSVQAGEVVKNNRFNDFLQAQSFQVQVPILVGKRDTPWALVINVPMATIDQSGDEVEQLIFMISLISGAVILALLWFVIARGMAPLTMITNQIKDIASGQHEKIPKVYQVEQGEIATLAQAFNRMVEALNKSRQNLLTVNNELEDRVSARTGQLEKALKQQQEMQTQLIETEKLASLGTLVAGVAHEINTPIGVALTGASHLREATENVKQKQSEKALTRAEFDAFVDSAMQMCSIVESNIQRATSLIGNFKMVAVDRSHEAERNILLTQYIDTVVDSLRPSFKKYRAELVMDIDDQATACCDPGTLAHILSNIIMNSFVHGFTDEQQTQRVITIECYAELDSIHLNVSDNGAGMPDEVKNRIFEPFYTTKRGDGGSGLGMHITYNMVTHKLNGTIKVESSPQAGTSIFITFPRHHQVGDGANPQS